jgi:hypothetical protein
VRGGFATEVGAGLVVSRFVLTGELTLGGGIGPTVRAGVLFPLWGPLGAQLTVDGVVIVTPVLSPGGGGTAELTWALGGWTLFAAGSVRWFSAPPGYRSSYGLLGLGVRWFWMGS